MTARRPVPWFLTDTGRRFTFGVITTAGISLSTLKFATHTFGIDYYKDFVRLYNNSKPAELPKELQNKCQQCLDLLNISGPHRKLITPFSVFGFDLFHAGTSFSKFGVAVGIPINFTYKSYDDIEKDNIMVNQKKIDWSSETGKKLADALVLPETVQKFAICREILMSQSYKVIYEATYPFISIFLGYNLAQYMNRRMNLYAAPTVIRASLYTLVGLFCTGMYFFMKDVTEVHYETQVDKRLCELGPEFIESGVVFYDKLLKRNQALRELMGKEGENKYSKLGNENFFLRQPRMALMHRKQFFQEQLKATSNNDEFEESL